MINGKPVSELDIGIDQGTTNALGGITRRLSMRIAKIKNVNSAANTVDVEWLWPIRGGANGIDIGRPYVGFRSGIHFVPEVGSIVIVGYAFNQILMLSYLLPSDYSKMLQGYEDNAGDASRIRQMSPGEISLNSVQDSEIYLHDQVLIQDRNLDSITIDPTDSSISLNSLIFYMDNEAGQIVMGPIIRSINGIDTVITDDGKSLVSSSGGKGLTEFNLTVQKFSDGTIFDGSENNILADLTIGTLVDDNGLKVINTSGNNIVTSFSLNSGANVNIDSGGNFNFNDGNILNPSSIPAIATPTLTTITGTIFSAQSQQRAAREGDRVVIPMSTPTNSLQNHPDLLAKSTYNITQLQQIAGMFMTPFGPCIGFIPSQPDVRLVGEITQGSDSVFIGSLNKTNEKNETLDNSL